MNESNENSVEQTSKLDPGKRLREARTGRRLSLEQVADDLCLTARQVEALENGDDDYLPGRTYVRGYIRNYARLLGIPADEVLGPEISASPEPGTHKFSTGKAVRAQEADNRRSILILTLAIMALVIGLLIAWWQGRETPEFTVSEEISAPATTQTPSAEFSETSPDSVASTPDNSMEEPQGFTPAPDEPESLPASTEDTADTAGESAGAATDVPAADTSVPAPLVIKYKADSWTDIRDADDKRLVYRTVASGETLELKGKPPYKLFFGFAKGVDVQYQGKEYDLSPYIRGVFARFTLN